MILIFNCCLKSIFIYGVETFREMQQMVLQYVKINVKVHTSLTYKKMREKEKEENTCHYGTRNQVSMDFGSKI